MSMQWHLYYVDFTNFLEISTWSDSDVRTIVSANKGNLTFDNPEQIILALSEIIKKQCVSEHASLYAQACEFLCNHFGTRIPQDAYDECRWDWIDEVEIITPLITSGPPLEFSLTENVLVGHLTPDDITDTIKNWSRYDTDDSLEPEQDEDPDIVSFRCLFVSWLKEARPNEGIVSFLA